MKTRKNGEYIHAFSPQDIYTITNKFFECVSKLRKTMSFQEPVEFGVTTAFQFKIYRVIIKTNTILISNNCIIKMVTGFSRSYDHHQTIDH